MRSKRAQPPPAHLTLASRTAGQRLDRLLSSSRTQPRYAAARAVQSRDAQCDESMLCVMCRRRAVAAGPNGVRAGHHYRALAERVWCAKRGAPCYVLTAVRPARGQVRKLSCAPPPCAGGERILHGPVACGRGWVACRVARSVGTSGRRGPGRSWAPALKDKPRQGCMGCLCRPWGFGPEGPCLHVLRPG